MNRFSYFRLALLALAAALPLAFLGCGGAPVPPLELTSHTPSADAAGVLLADAIELNFNEAVAAQTVTSGSLKVLDGSNELSYDKAFSSDGKTLTLTLTSAPASLPATLTVQIDGIENTRGSALSTSFSFTTADDWVELGSFVQADSGNDANTPSIALDADGHLVVAFRSGEASGYLISVRRWNGSTWESIGAPFNSGSSDSASHPDLALDGSGNPAIAFSEYNTADKYNVFVRYWDGTSWMPYGSGNALDLTLADSATGATISLDDNGSPSVFFSELSTISGITANRVHRAGYSSGLGGWFTVATPDNYDADRDAITPVSRMTRAGKLILSWVETTPNGRVIYVKNTGTDSFYGSPAEIYESTGDYIPHLSMQLDSNDNPVIVWREHPNSTGIFAKYWDGSSWKNYGGNDLVDANGFMVALALDSQDRPCIATLVSGHLIVKHWNGSSWKSYADEINIDPSQDVYSFDMVLDANDNPIVVWSEDDGSGGYVLHAKAYNGIAR